MFKEFKAFLLRGNVIDLAIGVIIGAAFTAIVNSVVTNLISPLIGMFTKSVNLDNMHFTINHAVFNYGAVINSLINFILTGFVLFIIVKSVNKISKKKEDASVTTELSLLTEIRDLLEKQEKTSSKK